MRLRKRASAGAGTDADCAVLDTSVSTPFPAQSPALPIASELPSYRVVILGAGRSAHGGPPTAVADVGRQGCVLDWLLAAFATLDESDVQFVGGYMAGAIMDRFRHIHFTVNPDWATTGPARSLAVAPLGSRIATCVSYADVVFRPDIVKQLDAREADLVVAVDTHWRVRYEGRSRSDIDAAEKIAFTGDDIIDVGKHVANTDGVAEFAGLLKLSGPTAARLQNAIAAGEFDPTDGLPEVIRFLVRSGVSTAIVDVNGQWAELNAPQDLARFVLGTKAESLERLRPLVRMGHIGDSVAFTHDEWIANRPAVLNRIEQAFARADVIVRSSALAEDSWRQSSAGAFTSVPDVPAGDTPKLAAGIERVLASYGEPRPDNQVLVQRMLRHVTMSGVVMTRTPSLGGPYYVINYDETSGRTDTVTSGEGASIRTMYLHRGMVLRPGLPNELYRLMKVVQEIEQLVGHDSLDIEFAFTDDGTAHILQVRPIAVAHVDQPVGDARVSDGLRDAIRYYRELQRPRPHLLGRSTQLSVMSDWNPAEIVGTKPSRLAFSLYRHLITDETWARQRAEYGYRDVRPANLLVDILGHPYIDVRATFNSFVPASLPDELAGRLVEHYHDHLTCRPELHDKVEFDVLFTCMTFDFDRRADRLRQARFSEQDIERLRRSLLTLTRNGIARCERDWASLEGAKLRFEAIRTSHLPPLEKAFLWLEDARLTSVLTFAHLARGGFVAASLLRSACEVGLLTIAQKDAVLASIRTVSSRLQDDARAVASGELTWSAFVERYGHLRPGTYDITSPSYASAAEDYLRPMVRCGTGLQLVNSDQQTLRRKVVNSGWVAHVFRRGEADDRCATGSIGSPTSGGGGPPSPKPAPYAAVQNADPAPTTDTPAAAELDTRTRSALAKALRQMDLGVDVNAFLRFVRRATEGREYSKFVFTRNLSAALEALAEFGASHFVHREELAHIRVQDLLELRKASSRDLSSRVKQLAEEGRDDAHVTQTICLPGQIRSELDLVCFEQLRAQPNFITARKVRAKIVCLSSRPTADADLAGKIVVTPNADPGFDWIFSHRIAGLLTMYGGANSHMAIRAAEFRLPAATGIGEMLYEQVSKAELIELDCASRTIRIVR